mmetsp:Transcript_64117/g.161543  ORF Transcript_64117/g.161543 Transcript_64117/m.161543 type:complete len:112 (+) Transcript_64117:335-670(+)
MEINRPMMKRWWKEYKLDRTLQLAAPVHRGRDAEHASTAQCQPNAPLESRPSRLKRTAAAAGQASMAAGPTRRQSQSAGVEYAARQPKSRRKGLCKDRSGKAAATACRSQS